MMKYCTLNPHCKPSNCNEPYLVCWRTRWGMHQCWGRTCRTSCRPCRSLLFARWGTRAAPDHLKQSTDKSVLVLKDKLKKNYWAALLASLWRIAATAAEPDCGVDEIVAIPILTSWAATSGGGGGRRWRCEFVHIPLSPRYRNLGRCLADYLTAENVISRENGRISITM